MKTPLLLSSLALLLTCSSVSAAPPNVRVWASAEAGSASFAVTNVPLDLTNAVQVALGTAHAIALRSDGTVVAWGGNSSGQCNVPPGLTDVTAVYAAGPYSAALRADRTLAFWGRLWPAADPPYFDRFPPSSMTNDVEMAAAHSAVLSVLKNGTIMKWHWAYAVLNDTTNAVAISMTENSDAYVVALTDAGRVSLGSRKLGTASFYDRVPADLTNAVAISAGSEHILALRSDGTVTAWGSWENLEDTRDRGQADIPAGLSNVVAIEASSYASFALRSDGTVIGWGTNSYVPPDLPFVTGLAAYGSLRAAIVEPSMVQPPIILLNPTPAKLIAPVGGKACFRVQAGGMPPLRYQWYFGENPIPGATTATLSLENLADAQSGSYRASVSNAGGLTWTEPAALTVLPVLSINMVPAITLNGTVGRDYRLEWVNPYAAPDTWLPLATVTLTNNPQYYFDLSAIGQPARLYRLVEISN